MTALGSSKTGFDVREPSPAIPASVQSQVWIDFDGTISVQDVLDEMIRRYATNDSWRVIEAQWQSGLIGSRECLSAEFSLIRISTDELHSFLEVIQVDPGFDALVRLCSEYGVPLTILSDGVETFIRRVLRRHQAHDVSVRANSISHLGDRLELLCPHSSARCRSGAAHCKCDSAKALSRGHRSSIYIGDGRSDLCPARSCDVVFAKGALAAALEKERRPFVPFSGLGDVHRILSDAWGRSTEVLG
jgi:2,3-diketo-5-methylthio-1-phosphopentane phosphatase